MRTRQHKLVAVLLLAAIGTSACGARLTEDQRAAALSSGHVEELDSDAAAGAAAPSTSNDVTDTVEPQPVASQSATAQAETASVEEAPAATSQGNTTADAATAAGQDGPAPQASVAAGPAAPADTRAMPAGGNGGATDIGVTETEIYVANIADVSGAVPGLFESAQLAVKAYIAYHHAFEGTVYGREYKFLPYDARLDTGANRTAAIEACENAFSAVGSISPMDQGAAPVIDECNIPDLRVSATTPQMKMVDNSYSVNPATDRVEPLGHHQWYADNFPEAVKSAAFLRIAGEVTEKSTQQVMDAQETIGYEYKYVQDVDITETNYAPFVLELIDREIEYVAFQGAYQQGVRLAEAMRQQNYWPTVYRLQSNSYTPDFIELGGAAVEDTHISVNAVLLEEVDQHPELQLYLQWLNQVAPGKLPNTQGIQAWSGMVLFNELVKKIGPNLTREAMLAEFAQIDGWTGNGLGPPAQIGRKWPIDCYVAVQVQDGAFVRVAPDSGFACGDEYADLR